MPSLTTSPATPRNDAADRYSPETAAEFTSGEIRRDATRKSDVVRIAATPRTPISSVTSTTGATASATPTSGPARSLVVLQALGAAQLPAGQQCHRRVRQHREHQPGHRDSQQPRGVQA